MSPTSARCGKWSSRRGSSARSRNRRYSNSISTLPFSAAGPGASQLQRATEAALQDGLARFETESGRVQFQGVEANLAEPIHRIEAEQKSSDKPAWRQALESARLPLYDVHWPAALVIEKSAWRSGGEIIKVGLNDGRVRPLSVG